MTFEQPLQNALVEIVREDFRERVQQMKQCFWPQLFPYPGADLLLGARYSLRTREELKAENCTSEMGAIMFFVTRARERDTETMFEFGAKNAFRSVFLEWTVGRISHLCLFICTLGFPPGSNLSIHLGRALSMVGRRRP